MIKPKKFMALLFLMPSIVGAQAPVVDDNEHFARQQEEALQPLVPNETSSETARWEEPKYHEPKASNEYRPNEGQPLVDSGGGAVRDNAALIDRLHKLQQEMQELRGQLEVQSHELKVLQEKQLAYYKDLDSRLGQSAEQSSPKLSLDSAPKKLPQEHSKTESNGRVAEGVISTVPLSINTTPHANPADEQIGYLASYELVKNKQYDQALSAMQAFISKYPRGGYTANAQYWLGELYLLRKEYIQAIEHFDVVIHQFPNAQKIAACLLKSGYAYAAKGENAQAKERFQRLIREYANTPTAQLARQKMQEMNAL